MDISVSIPIEYEEDFNDLERLASDAEKLVVSGLDGHTFVQWVLPLIASGAVEAIGQQLAELVFAGIRRASARKATEMQTVTQRVSITVNGIPLHFETEVALRSQLTQ
jgi:hypothetical protein